MFEGGGAGVEAADYGAEAAGLVVAWSGSAPVTTSARRVSRAPGGFAGHLARTEAITQGRPEPAAAS